MTNYYPWNIEGLRNFIKSELSEGKSLIDIEKELGVSLNTVEKWLKTPYSIALTINIEQIMLIARYRDWTVDRTLRWLGISSVHLEEILERSRTRHQLNSEAFKAQHDRTHTHSTS